MDRNWQFPPWNSGAKWGLFHWREGDGWMLKTLIMTSAVLLWSVCEKLSPAASVCFLCLMLKKQELNLCFYGVFGFPYIMLFASLASDAVHQMWPLASYVELAGVNRGCSGTGTCSAQFKGQLTSDAEDIFWYFAGHFVRSPCWYSVMYKALSPGHYFPKMSHIASST